MNNKGMTLVELIASFTLASVIIVLLINVILILRNTYTKSSIKSELIMQQSGLSQKVNQKMTTDNLKNYSSCGENCYDFEFTDETIRLTIDKEKRTVVFGSFSYTYPKNTEISDIEITKDNYSTIIGNNSLLVLKIPITNSRFSGEDFGINVVYPYNSLKTEF